MWLFNEDYGVDEWYREVPRKPFSHEKVKVITDLYEEEGIELGSVFDVNTNREVMIEVEDKHIFLHETEYVTLEFTWLVRVEGKEYKRDGKVKYEGDLILLLRDNDRKGYRKGQILKVVKIEGDMLSARNEETEEIYNIWDGEYMKIVPLTKEGSVERRLLDRFDDTEKAILASDLPIEEAFRFVLEFRSVREKQKNLLKGDTL